MVTTSSHRRPPFGNSSLRRIRFVATKVTHEDNPGVAVVLSSLILVEASQQSPGSQNVSGFSKLYPQMPHDWKFVLSER